MNLGTQSHGQPPVHDSTSCPMYLNFLQTDFLKCWFIVKLLQHGQALNGMYLYLGAKPEPVVIAASLCILPRAARTALGSSSLGQLLYATKAFLVFSVVVINTSE